MKNLLLAIAVFTITCNTLAAQEVTVITKSNNEKGEKPLMVIDGVISDKVNMDDINPNDIKSVNVIKGKMANEKYGSKGENGVVEIITKKNKGIKITIDTNEKSNTDTSIKVKENLSIMIDGDNITINGKPADKNDPRLKKMGKVKTIRAEKGKDNQITIEEITTNDGPSEESSDDVMDFMTPPPPPTNAAFLGVMSEENEKGAKINNVSEESPAAKAGLKQDDIIIKLNDKKIDGPKSLYEAVGACKPEDKVTINYLRAGKEQTTSATLAKNKALNAPRVFSFSMPNGQMPNNMRKGFRISPGQNFNFEMPEAPEAPERSELDGLLNQIDGSVNRYDKKPKLGISIEDTESGDGVRIKNVNTGSAAEKAGFKVNDLITEFDGQKVTDVNDLKWNYLQEGQVLKFSILRNGEKKKIEVKIPKKLKSADL